MNDTPLRSTTKIYLQGTNMSYKSDIRKVTRVFETEEFPAVILIDNLNACNLRCSMCDHKNMKKYRSIQKMDFDLYKKLVDEISLVKPDARVWEIFFGDPFLCNDMAARIKYAKDRGLKDVVLNTNGVLMTREKAKSIIQAGLDGMYVGIDAATEETYNKIRIGGDFKKTVKNVIDYRDLLARHGNVYQKVFVQFVVSEINQHETEDFRRFWKEEGVNVKIRPKVSWAGLVEAENLQDNQWVERKPCYWQMSVINVCADGNVAFCSVDVHCRVPCGNVRDKSIKEVWSDQLKKYRGMQRQGRYDELPDMCRKCSDWQSTYAEFYDCKE
jgi:radical SAM protein with 4Fe4S-binding SPASM domain